MNNLTLFWHRRDLRLTDNIGLSESNTKTSKIIGVFCFDDYILNRDDIAPARITYLIGCLKELQKSYRQLGSDLLILKGKPEILIPQLATTLKANNVNWNLDIEPYSKLRDQKIEASLKQAKITVKTYWDQLLHYPKEILTNSNNPYTVYTPFWKNWIKKTKQNIATKPIKLDGLNSVEKNLITNLISNIPTVKELGYIWHNPLPLKAGEVAAQERLDYFCDYLLSNYRENRNFPAIDGTSQLSAPLKFGVIGIRTIWQKTIEALENSNSDEERVNIETWQKELAWREFFQHCLYFYPELEKGAYKEHFKNFPWHNNEKHFQAWCEGKTGYPIVDASMRQLNETGWMHNRCRMIVANFLTKDLIIDWRWGEKYFMQKLYDGDLSSNNGGWQWSASSGMDAQPLRIFNPSFQSQKFDPEAEYIRQWLPEISSMDTEYLVTGKIPPLECQNYNYPLPIVDHHVQQRKFKQLYQSAKDNLK